ncbi:twist neighbor [Nannochloropsis gaditana]|uniref:Twist neighbor n=1 Tax=Nannochloropsis gaditana TaxID=72520 RepID=W7TIX5_9STRA|nr:twist neighbor [Nannochloropsis gaditana]
MPKRRRVNQEKGNDVAGEDDKIVPSPVIQVPFQEQRVLFKLALLPDAMGNLEESIHEKLHGMLMKYNQDVGGILLTLSQVRFPPSRRFASMMGDLPHLHVRVEATSLVFTPEPGMSLTGVVIKVTSTHVALLVYGLFNAAIAREDMPDAYAFDYDREAWVGTGGKEVLGLGEEVAFRVVLVHEAAGLIALDGSLREEGGEPRAPVAGLREGDGGGKGGEGGREVEEEERKGGAGREGKKRDTRGTAEEGASVKKRKEGTGKAEAKAHKKGKGKRLKGEKGPA